MKSPQSECLKFSARLIEAMLDAGQQSLRKSQTGVTTLKLKEVAGVTNEMARRYTLGLAWPDNEKMAKIAAWLDVRQAWLQYAELPKQYRAGVAEDFHTYNTDRKTPLSPTQIDLLQHNLVYAKQLNEKLKLDLTDRALAKVAAIFFNHCLTHDTHPENIPSGVRDAVIMAIDN